MIRFPEGEQHYDIISAFIKSMRGSDPNAAVYWLARMIEGGEDVKFIARRLVIRGFFAEIISKLKNTEIEDRLMQRIDDELSKVGQ